MKHVKQKSWFMLMVLAIMTLPNLVWADDAMVVVVNAKNPVTKMSADEVSQLFMGQSEFFPGGSPATAIDQPESTPLRTEFDAKVLGKTPSQLHAYWSKIVFTGKGKPLKEVPTSKDVVDFLNKNPNAIGYMEKSAVDNNVKVVYAF